MDAESKLLQRNAGIDEEGCRTNLAAGFQIWIASCEYSGRLTVTLFGWKWGDAPVQQIVLLAELSPRQKGVVNIPFPNLFQIKRGDSPMENRYRDSYMAYIICPTAGSF